MKHNIDSYELHRSGKIIRYSIRMKVTMKDDVDIDVLRNSINIALKRYPYFRKQIILASDGSYDLIDNDRDIVVIETTDCLPLLGSEEVGRHLLYVDCSGKDMYFNFSHSLAGGKGLLPLVKTCLYQYVTDKYKVNLDTPNIRKPDSELLDGEDGGIDIDRFDSDNIIHLKKKKRGHQLVGPYIKSFLFPFAQNRQHYILTFESKDILKYAKGNDSSVASAFIVFIFKAMCKVLPKSVKRISCGISHNPVADFGYPNLHSNLLTHITVRYDRYMENYDNELLGTITRSQIFLQSDPNYTCIELKRRFSTDAALDSFDNPVARRICSIFRRSPLNSDGGETFLGETFILNYAGFKDFGQLDDYIESFVPVIDGHIITEISALRDRMFMCFMQMDRSEKYINAVKQVFEENNIPYTIKGPYRTDNVRVELPRKKTKK